MHDIEALRATLRAETESVVTALLGSHTKALSTRRTLRFGSKGSLAVEIAGPRKGLWFSHEGDEGSDLFGLIQHVHGCDFPAAIDWARKFTGLDAGEAAPAPARPAAPANDDAAELAQRVEIARRIAAGAVPLSGTPGELYLNIARGIATPHAGWPSCIRWHAGHCAVVAVATDAAGAIQVVQRVHVTPDGHKLDNAELARRKLLAVKLTNGPQDGAAVRLPGNPSGPLLLAEGPETGLSAWAATGHETWVALGSIAKLAPPAGRRVVMCRDDDPRYSPADRKHTKTLREWQANGLDVLVATPAATRAFDKSDLNDTMRRGGADAVRERIQAALQAACGGSVRLPIRVVRDRLKGAVGSFFDRVRASSASALDAAPIVHAIKADVGTGKSVAVHAEAVRTLTEMRARGDLRTGVIAVPRHDLADEQAAAITLKADELHVAVWRGMDRPDPDAPGQAMCQNPDAVKDARDAGAHVYEAACRQKLPDGSYATCPFFTACGYQRQRESSADLWLVPHDLLFNSTPAAIGTVAFLVIDESIHAKGLEGIGPRPDVLSIDALAQPDSITRSEIPLINKIETDALRRAREKLSRALAPLAFDGVPAPVPAAALDGLTAAECSIARRLEFRRWTDAAIYPGMPAAARREAAKASAGNATVARMGRVWEGAEALLGPDAPERSGWLATAIQGTDAGPVKALRIKGRKAIRDGWLVPTLLIDATMNVELLRPYLPQVELIADLQADAPHQHVRQVTDRAYSKAALDPDTTDAAEAKRRAKNRRELHAIINREARAYGGKPALVITNKGVREAMPAIGPMTPSISMAHHGAIAGRDDWRNVALQVIVGRMMPAPAAVEDAAEALTGRAAERLNGWYDRVPVMRELADGSAVQAEADRHPDPVAEALRWQACEGELIQDIGRSRGVNRDESNPVDILLMTDAVLPIPVESVLIADDLKASPMDLMMGRGGMALGNAADAATAYPEMWTAIAAKQALMRWRANPDGISPLYKVSCRGLIPSGTGIYRVEYQRAGARLSPAVAWFDPSLVSDPAAWLAERLGALAWCKVEQPAAPAPALNLASVPRIGRANLRGIPGWNDELGYWVPPPAHVIAAAGVVPSG